VLHGWSSSLVEVGDQVRIVAPGSGVDGTIGEITEDYREDGPEGMNAVLVTYAPGKDIMVYPEFIEPYEGITGTVNSAYQALSRAYKTLIDSHRIDPEGLQAPERVEAIEAVEKALTALGPASGRD